MNNPVLQAILDRRSIRAYEDRQISGEEKQALLDAALASPTGANRQAWFFSFCQNKQLLDEISDEVRKAIEKTREVEDGYSVHFHAPTVIFIATPPESEKRGATLDAGIAVENLAIAAQGMGLGSVILGMPREAFDGEKGPEFEKRLKFPEGFEFRVAIAVGYPATTKEAHVVGENKYVFVD